MIDEFGWEWTSQEAYDDYQKIIQDIVKKLGSHSNEPY